MTFNWSKYLNLAQELAGNTTTPSQEAKLRAISRSYYAAFIQARNFLRDRDGLAIPLENTHRYVINQFKNSSDGARRKVGGRLLRLRQARNQADYNDTVNELVEGSRDALTLAKRVISELANL